MEIVVEALLDHGLDVVVAGDAEAALAEFEAHPEIRLLFSDVMMPGKLDGCDLAREIHARRPEVGVILTSGVRTPASCDIPEGGHFVPKPYSPDAIARLISAMLT